MNLQAQNIRLGRWCLLPLLAAIVVLIFVPKMLIVLTAAVVIFCLLAIYLVAHALNGRMDFVVLAWVLLFPLGYYFVSFPRERSVFTLDRALVGLLIIAMSFGPRGLQIRLPKAVRRAGVAWAVFLVVILLSCLRSDNPPGNMKELMDIFGLPAILAWYVVRNFRLRHHLVAIHCVTCLMSIYVACIGLAEMRTGQDLLPLPSAAFQIEATGLVRVNGPFSSNDSFALIGLISFCFLLFLRRAIGKHLAPWRKFLHAGGLASALAAAVMPLFRSVLITLVLIALFEFYLNKKASVRVAVATLMLLGVLGFISLRILVPGDFEGRISDPADLYARVAQQRQALGLFLAHPIFGVGWGKYIESAYNFPRVSYKGVDSVDSAHNTLGALLIETGLVAFLPFVTAQVLLIRAFWRLRRRRTYESLLASNLFIYIFASYWITGMALTSGYSADLNIWYLFVTAALYKFAITELPQAKILPRRRGTVPDLPLSLRQPINV